MNSNELTLLDADGTVTTIDVLAALEGRGSPEIQVYMDSASLAVSRATELSQREIFEGMRMAILTKVFPDRAKYKYWATFPSENGPSMKIAPAVDHFLLAAAGIEEYLRDKPGIRIRDFLAKPGWQNDVFKAGSDASLAHAAMDDDAISAIDSMLRSDARVCLITNSSTKKARHLVEQAGFPFAIGEIPPGKVGIVGDAQKFLVDTTMPDGPSAFVDLSNHFGEPIVVDLRRRKYRARVRDMMAAVGATSVHMVTDMTPMDSYPLQAELGSSARFSMKTNPTSVPQEVAAARELLNASVSDKLSELLAA